MNQGAHYPSDVVGGILVGALSAVIAFYITRLIYKLLEKYHDNAFCKFVLEFDESDVKTQEEEVSGFAIADLNEIKRYADEGIFLHYDSIRQAFEE